MLLNGSCKKQCNVIACLRIKYRYHYVLVYANNGLSQQYVNPEKKSCIDGSFSVHLVIFILSLW